MAAELPARKSDLHFPATDATGLEIGKVNIVDGRLLDGPLSFAKKNAMRLRDLQDALVRVMRPDLLPAGSPADKITTDDRAYLQKTLGTLPRESGLARYDRNVVLDYQYSPFLRGIERVRARKQFRIYAKVGQAYGFIAANAYVVEIETGRAFFLSAVVYANPDEVMNSDAYAYETVSIPTMADVAEVFTRNAFAN